MTSFLATDVSDPIAEWVDHQLARMTLRQAVGHLLCPEDRGYSPDEWKALLADVPLGSVFIGPGKEADLRSTARLLQSESEIPLLVASDLEHGAGCMIAEATDFPWLMALGATQSTELARAMGRATAREGRATGIHWSFSPVVDLNLNFQNPVTNVRSLGDRADEVAQLASAIVLGMQERGQLAACAKHFPGDGVDDRDHHICTSVNSLDVPTWWATYGRVWRAVIEAGLMSVMSGHIAFPDHQAVPSRDALPATLCRKLQNDLLREELGFDGVIVSDAAPMIGLMSRTTPDRAAVENIRAGSDVFLFADPRRDFERLMSAVRAGELSEERVYASARRVLTMKARLGLATDPGAAPITEGERASFAADATRLAERSITVARPVAEMPALKPGNRVLTVTIRYEDGPPHLTSPLTAVDEALRARGLQVDHLENPGHEELIADIGAYDRVFLNFAILPHQRLGTIRLTGGLPMSFWRGFWVGANNVVCTSFGSPYHLYELPHLPNMLLAYGTSPFSQRAAVRVWLGEIPAAGICPVALP